jgi:riboflavin kinase
MLTVLAELTANLPEEAIAPHLDALETGVHFGYARVCLGSEAGKADQVLPMVMSIGWNPYYKNEKRTAVSKSSCLS